MTVFKKIVLGTALAASALTAAAPASAQNYYRGHRGGDSAGVAIGAGIIGLAIGAVLASGNHNRSNGGYYYSTPGYGSYNNGSWYEGYRYDNGWFYDRRGERRYDRRQWDERRSGYDRGYDHRGYTQGYDRQDYSQNGYDGRGYGY